MRHHAHLRILSVLAALTFMVSAMTFIICSFPTARSAIVVDEAKLNFTGHLQGAVHSVDWSPDSSYIVSGGQDSAAIVWDSTTGGTWLHFDEHQGPVLCIDWSGNGQRIASGSADDTVKIWDPADGTVSRTLSGHGASVNGLEWSPSGTELVTGSSDHTAKVWNGDSGAEVTTFNGHNSVVHCVSWSPDNIKIASGGDDDTVRIWSSSTAMELVALEGHSDAVTAISWSPNGTWIASGSLDGTVRIWDLVEGTNILTFYGHDGGVLAVEWLDSGKTLASAGEDSMIRVWDPAGGRVYLNYTAHRDVIRSIALSGDGDRLVSGSDDHTCRIWGLNIPPPAPVLTVRATAIQRSFSSLIMANVPDYPDPVDVLLPEFQYRRHSKTIWYEKYLSNPKFESGSWRVHFTPDINASLGTYDLRVRFWDERELASPWTTQESKLEVLNNEPSAVIWSAPSTIDRGQGGTVAVAVSDVETPADLMLVRTEYAPEFVEDWNSDIFSGPVFNTSSGMWDCGFTFPLSTETGGYRIRTRCTDRALGVSDWDYLPTVLTVSNNVPTVEEFSVSPGTLKRGESANIRLTVNDPEEGAIIPEIDIEVRSPTSDWRSLHISPNVDGGYYSGRLSTFPADDTGSYEFRVRIGDANEGRSEWIYYTDRLEVLNNPPVPAAGRVIPLMFYEDKAELFDLSIYASDLEDGPGGLSWEIHEQSTSIFRSRMIDDITLELSPSPDMGTGQGWILLKVSDTDGDFAFKELDVEVLPVGDRPEIEIHIMHPVDGITIGDPSVTLSWATSEERAQVRYDVYLGDSLENITLMEKNLAGTEWELTGLENNTVYWWKVEFHVYNIPYTYESELVNFRTNIGFISVIDLVLSLDRDSVTIEHGGAAIVNMTLTNEGNVPLEVRLDTLGVLEDFVSMKRSVRIEPGGSRTIPVTVHGHESLVRGDYTLTILASFGGDQRSGKVDVTLGTGPEASGGLDSVFMYMIFIGSIIVIVLLILLLFISVYRRLRKKRDDHTPVPVYVPRYETPEYNAGSLSLVPPSYGQDANAYDQAPYMPGNEEKMYGDPASPQTGSGAYPSAAAASPDYGHVHLAPGMALVQDDRGGMLSLPPAPVQARPDASMPDEFIAGPPPEPQPSQYAGDVQHGMTYPAVAVSPPPQEVPPSGPQPSQFTGGGPSQYAGDAQHRMTHPALAVSPPPQEVPPPGETAVGTLPTGEPGADAGIAYPDIYEQIVNPVPPVKPGAGEGAGEEPGPLKDGERPETGTSVSIEDDLDFLKTMLGDVIKSTAVKSAPVAARPMLPESFAGKTEKRTGSSMTIEERLAFLDMLTKGRDAED